ncbi:MAG: CopM family metallochaperone [Propylenella sp.]
MRTHLKTIATAMLFAIPGLAVAQTDPHHPAGEPAAAGQAQAAPAPEAAAPPQGQMMSPEMMQMMMPMMMQMMQNCMGMMQTMRGAMGPGQRQGGMGPGTMQGGGGNMPMTPGGTAPMMQGVMSEAMAAYMAAMSKMDAPMMQGIQASSDPDVAFVKGMIPHHQGAIDMAKAVLQYGDDEQVKAWANQIIAAQEKEIAEMQEWLKAHSE